jgi:hypothetical protein
VREREREREREESEMAREGKVRDFLKRILEGF